MATTNKDFRVKNGLVVEGSTSTVNGNQVLTTASSLDSLSDVVITTPSTSQVLSYNGTNWVNSSSGGGGTTTNALTIGTGLSGTSFDGSAAVTIANTGVLSVNGSTGAITGIATTAGTLAQFAATTSSQLAGVISDETGSGALVFATSPTLVTPSIGVATGTSFNSITGLSSTNPAALGTVAVGTGTTTARADHVHPTTGLGLTASGLNQFAATTSAQLAGVISDETGSGALVFATSPTLTTPVLGAATGTSLALTGGSLTARSTATRDAVIISGRAGGTSSFGVTITPTTLTASRTVTLANGNTTLQAGTMAITGGTLAQFAATTSSQLRGVISDETGSGSLVFGTDPTISNLVLSGTLTAGGATGTSGQLLSSTGSGIQWKTISAPASGDQFLLMGA